MRLKKLLTLTLAGALMISGIATVNAAELDIAWYAAKNPDVVAAFGNSPEMLKLHYEMFGRKEARMANTHDVEAQLRKMFNPTEYAKLYPDVKAALGENAEAMFQHYIAFGLLESRRPSEKVSKATAANLKKSVEKAMASAGLAAVPGSAQLVAIITGEIKADVVGGAAVQQALSQVASVVEKAVTSTVQEVNNPSSGSSGGGSSSSGSSGGSSEQGAPVSGYVYTVSGSNPLYAHVAGETNYEKLAVGNVEKYFTPSETSTLTAKTGCSYVTLAALGESEALTGLVQKKGASAGLGDDNSKKAYRLTAATVSTNDFSINAESGDITLAAESAERLKTLHKNNGALIGTGADENAIVTAIVNYFMDKTQSDAGYKADAPNGGKLYTYTSGAEKPTEISISEYFEKDGTLASGKNNTQFYFSDVTANDETKVDSGDLAQYIQAGTWTLSSKGATAMDMTPFGSDEDLTGYITVSNNSLAIVENAMVFVGDSEDQTNGGYKKLDDLSGYSDYFKVNQEGVTMVGDVKLYDSDGKVIAAKDYFQLSGENVVRISGKVAYKATVVDLSNSANIAAYVTALKNGATP